MLEQHHHHQQQQQQEVMPVISEPARHKTPKDCWANIDYFIRYWGMNDKQAAAFRELRTRLQDDHHHHNTPNYVVRYLRTQNYNVHRAEVMFRKMIAWREANGADTILGDYTPPRYFLSHDPTAIIPETDYEGDPVLISRLGVTDAAGMLHKYGHDKCVKYEIWKRETMTTGKWIENWEASSGRPIKQVIIIQDMHGLSRRLLSTRIAKLFGVTFRFDQDYYPDTFKKVVVIRAPKLFTFAWNVAKHFFDRHMVEKMEFCGEHGWEDVLKKYMDLTILPDCIYPGGRGKPVEGMPTSFEGGLIPLHDDE
jgi:hypothetical protein